MTLLPGIFTPSDSGSAEGAGGETPSEPYVAMCDAHANEVALFLAKVLEIFHEKKITALW